MIKEGKAPEFVRVFWNFFASIRLTVVILLSLAATSVIGTLLPQNQAPVMYFEKYGETAYRIFYALGLFDMYHAWWFRMLLIALAVNIIVCSIDRLGSAWKIIFPKTFSVPLSRFEKSRHRQSFELPAAPCGIGEWKTAVENLLSRGFSRVRSEDLADGFCVFAEKGRWTRLGVYIVHVSVLLLLAGGTIGSIYGFDGYVKIREGQTVDTIRLRSGETIPMGFGIRCDDFSMSHYPDGTPSEYRSELTIMEAGKAGRQKSIIVNDPLHHRGLRFFQSSYEQVQPSPEDLADREINLTIQAGLSYELSAKIGRPLDLPENMGRFVIREYVPSYLFRGMRDIGACFIGEWTDSGGETREIVLPVRFPKFDRMRGGDFFISVKAFPQVYRTVLSVRKDPGVPLVYAGFLIMIAGFVVTFFMSHRQICVWAVKGEQGYLVSAAGLSDKNRIDMGRQVELVRKRLEREWA